MSWTDRLRGISFLWLEMKVNLRLLIEFSRWFTKFLLDRHGSGALGCACLGKD